jgi:hypothetical protein
MKKSIKVAPKKRRGRPATGKDPHIAARMPAALIAQVEAWAAANNTNRSNAFRRLVEIGLTRSKSVRPPSAKGVARAKQLAAKTIDRLVDPAAPIEEAANRKRRLLKGPEEFRELRVDHEKSG